MYGAGHAGPHARGTGPRGRPQMFT